MLKKTTDAFEYAKNRTKEDVLKDELYDFNLSAGEAANARGCYVVTPQDNEIFVDIDSDDDFMTFQRRYMELQLLCDIKITKNIPSQSGLPHRHIYLRILSKDGKPVILNEWKRIAIQFTLGSDKIKETLSTYRAITGVEIPTRFFEPKIKGD